MLNLDQSTPRGSSTAWTLLWVTHQSKAFANTAPIIDIDWSITQSEFTSRKPSFKHCWENPDKIYINGLLFSVERTIDQSLAKSFAT